MSFSNTAGTSIIPTISRLVLCAAFLPAGYNKLFQESEFSGAEADRLIELDVIDAPPTQARITAERSILLTAWQDEAGETEPPAAVIEPQSNDAVDQASGTETPSTTGTYTVKKVHNLTLMLDRAGIPSPQWLALLAAWTELLGGAFILVGFLSRIWGLGLAIAMGVAFYLTTMPTLGDVGFLKVLFDGDMMAFHHSMFTQLGLFVMAFGVFMTGAGPLSLDRALFKKAVEGDEFEDDEE